LRRHFQHGVSKLCDAGGVKTSAMLNNSSTLPRFYARLQAQFLILPRICFLLFHALYSSQNFLLCRVVFLFVARILLFMVFKMGGSVRTTAMFRATSTFTFLFSHHIFTSLRAALSFVASRYFNPCRVALFLRLRQDSLFLPRCHLSLRHDIYDCTVMPSFVAPRYL